jgi:hypothetical protein
MPLPLEGWCAETWTAALTKRPGAVSRYVSQARKKVLSDDYTFLVVWEKIGKSVPGDPQKKVNHHDLHLDKLYDWGESKPAL